MSLNKDIFAYGMAQLPVASSRVNPYDPYLKWSREVAQLQAGGEALVRYVSYAVHDEACAMFDGPDIKDKDDIAKEFCTCGYIEAYEALSQELRDAISKESQDEPR